MKIIHFNWFIMNFPGQALSLFLVVLDLTLWFWELPFLTTSHLHRPNPLRLAFSLLLKFQITTWPVGNVQGRKLCNRLWNQKDKEWTIHWIYLQVIKAFIVSSYTNKIKIIKDQNFF